MKIIQYLVLLCLVTGIVGCGRNITQMKTTPVPTATIFPTAERTATASLSPVEATETPLPQPTGTPVFPISTMTPTSYPPTAVPTPLSSEGPWFLLSKDTFYDGPTAIIDPILTNTDGSAWEYLRVPRPADVGPDDYSWWYAEQVPHKPLIIIRGYFSEYFPDCANNFFSPTTVDPHSDLLSFVKLPDNKIIRQFTLLGAKAKAQIQKDDCALKEGDGIPSVLGVTHLSGRHRWLQNGRYLVFPAAPDGPAADLYIYDFDTDTVRRLTTRQNNPDIIGLSPDGQTIIYQGVSKINWYHEEVIESSGVYAVSLSGTDQLLFKPEYMPWGIDWISQSQVVITDGFCDLRGTGKCTARLLLTDISSGTSEVLYRNSKTWFRYAITDPTRHVLLLLDPPADMPGASEGKPELGPDGKETGRVQGIYQYDFGSRVLHPVMLENPPSSVHWSQEDQAFILGYDHYDEQNRTYYRTFHLMRLKSWQDYQLEERGSINRDWVSYSPDRQWHIGKVGEESYIMDQQDRPVQKVMGDGGYWSPDSSSFVQLTEKVEPKETWFSVYSRESGWQNTLTRHLLKGIQWWGLWINPKK